MPTFFGVAAIIIVCFYLAIRDTGLPLALYVNFLLAGISLFFWLFWYAYQVMMVIRGAEDIVGILSSTPMVHYAEMSSAERKYLARGDKGFGILDGDFCGFFLLCPCGNVG